MNTEQSNERPMSAEQRKMIFALYRDCGIGEELRHDVQHGVASKISLTDFTAHDAARLIDHLEHLQKVAQKESSNPARRNTPAGDLSLTSSPQKVAGTTSVTVGSVPAPKLVPAKAGNQSRGKHDYITKVHKLPSPEQLAVLERLYCFADYLVPEARTAFTRRIIKRDRAHSMWEVESVIFGLMPQTASRMLEEIRYLIGLPLSDFERGFLFTNRATITPSGKFLGWNAVELELKEYIKNKNKRGRRTMPRFSLTKFFEIVEKYK